MLRTRHGSLDGCDTCPHFLRQIPSTVAAFWDSMRALAVRIWCNKRTAARYTVPTFESCSRSRLQCRYPLPCLDKPVLLSVWSLSFSRTHRGSCGDRSFEKMSSFLRQIPSTTATFWHSVRGQNESFQFWCTKHTAARHTVPTIESCPVRGCSVATRCDDWAISFRCFR